MSSNLCAKLYIHRKIFFVILTVKLKKGAINTSFSDAMITRILDLCKEKGMNINQLGTQAGINPSTIRSIIKKRCVSPKAETVYYICLGFGISLKEFYDSELFENVIDND